MRLIQFLRLIVLLIGGLLPPIANAWDSLGHEIVAAIALSRIAGSPAEAHIQALLNPPESLITISTWADCVKSESVCKAPLNNEMRSFVHRYPHHFGFHYADIPVGYTRYGSDLIGARPDDVVHVLKDSVLTLQHSPQATLGFTEREALFLVVHLVGDLHQPLHMGSLYLNAQGERILPKTPGEADRSHTRGGNLVCVGHRSLHSLWDDEGPAMLKKAAKEDSIMDLAQGINPGRRKVRYSDPLAEIDRWANDSVKLATQVLPNRVGPARFGSASRNPCASGAEVSKTDVWDLSLSREDRRQIASQSFIALGDAGLHLAELLEAIWPR